MNESHHHMPKPTVFASSHVPALNSAPVRLPPTVPILLLMAPSIEGRGRGVRGVWPWGMTSTWDRCQEGEEPLGGEGGRGARAGGGGGCDQLGFREGWFHKAAECMLFTGICTLIHKMQQVMLRVLQSQRNSACMHIMTCVPLSATSLPTLYLPTHTSTHPHTRYSTHPPFTPPHLLSCPISICVSLPTSRASTTN